MRRFKQVLLSLTVLTSFAVALVPLPVGAVNVYQGCSSVPSADAASTVCKSTGDTLSPIVTTIVNLLLFAVGIVSVIMIIIGGFTYVTSGGDNAAVAKAKNTILYAIIGLVVAFLAYAIVNWVILALIK